MNSDDSRPAKPEPIEREPDEARRREFIKRLAKAVAIPAVVVAVNSNITPANADR